MPRKIPAVTVKVPRHVYDRLQTLVSQVSRHGWASLGVPRDDPPSMSAILDEATAILANRVKGKEAKK
jgi:hypothetical protein